MSGASGIYNYFQERARGNWQLLPIFYRKRTYLPRNSQPRLSARHLLSLALVLCSNSNGNSKRAAAEPIKPHYARALPFDDYCLSAPPASHQTATPRAGFRKFFRSHRRGPLQLASCLLPFENYTAMSRAAQVPSAFSAVAFTHHQRWKDIVTGF